MPRMIDMTMRVVTMRSGPGPDRPSERPFWLRRSVSKSLDTKVLQPSGYSALVRLIKAGYFLTMLT